MTFARSLWPDEVVPGTRVVTFERGETYIPIVVLDYYEGRLIEFVLRHSARRPGLEWPVSGVGKVYLVREPHNEYDGNAISIWSPGHGPIAYVPRHIAEQLAPQVDSIIAAEHESHGSLPAITATLVFSGTARDYGEDLGGAHLSPETVVRLAISGAARSSVSEAKEWPSRLADPEEALLPDGTGLPAAWYVDPEDDGHWAWWDGTDWTGQAEPRG